MLVSKFNAVSILEFESYTEDADKLFTEEEREDIKTLLAFSPDIGTVIPGTGGLRKVRVGIEKKGKGKRGGARVIYYFHSEAMPLAVLAVYAKGEKIDLTADEKKLFRQLINEYVAAFKK